MRLAGCWLLLLGTISLHWTGTKGESPSEAAEGNSPQDIIFLVDNTAGVEQPEFNNLLGFLQRYASSLAGQGYLGRDQTRMGVVTWGQSGLPFRAQFPLDMHFTNDTLQAAIAAIPFETGGIGVDDLAMTLEFLVDAFSGDFGARSYADHTAVLLLDAIGTGDIRIPASRVKDANIILYVIGVHEGTPSQTLMELVSTLEQFGTVAPNTGIQSTDLATFATVNSDPFVAALVTHLRTWSIHCAELSVTNGNVVYTNATNFGSMADVQCNFGFMYNPTGASPTQCLESGDWTPPIGTCTLADCGPLVNPYNGAVNVSTTTFGSEATYNCGDGYILVGPNIVVCQSDGTWSEEPPVCREVDCGPLDEPMDGYIVYNNATTLGSTAEYFCDFGYSLTAAAVPPRTCLSDGEWDSTAQTCTPFDCAPLSDPLNGAVDTSRGTTYKSLAVYTCDEGYVLSGEPVRTCGAFAWNGSAPSCNIVDCGRPEMVNNSMLSASFFSFSSAVWYVCQPGFILRGEAQRVCQADGSWSNAAPYCELIDCDVLDGIANGYVTYMDGTLVNSTASYSCNTGYMFAPAANTMRTCTLTGLWDGTEPQCIRIDCGNPDAPMNGLVEFNETTYQSVAVYSCNEGFILEGDRATTCNLAGQWIANTTCRIADCGSLPDIENGAVTVSPDSEFGAVANYSCNSGYVLRGNDTRNCDADEQWDNSEPLCTPVDCGVLSQIENGYVRYLNGTGLGQRATYGCNRGYNISMPLTITCQEDGQWTPATLPVCSVVECSVLQDPTNGVVDLNGGMLYRSIAVYACNTGYTLNGNLTRMCLEDGTWNRQEPTCERVECTVTSTIPNGQVMAPMPTLYTDVVSYNCSDGFELIGPNERACLADGHLNETRPFCQPIVPSCIVLDSIENGYIEYTNGTLIGSVATYECHEGYYTMDAGMQMCLSNETWDGTEATCNIVDCLSPPALTDGSVDTSRGTTYQSVAVYQCNEGYTLQGQAITACQANGTWSGTTPTCELVDCGSLDDIPDGVVGTPQGTLYGATVTYLCNIGYLLLGNDTRECRADGTWSGSEPLCKVVDCDVLGGIDEGFLQYSSGTTYDSLATYNCRRGYTLTGSDTRRCQDIGLWNGTEPQCNIVDCMDPPTLTDGSVDTSRGTTYQSVAVYQCNEGYTLQGQAITACQEDGTWSGTTPTCALVDCGSLDDILDGTVSTPQGTLYGATANYSCNTGYRLVGNGTRECQVDGRWSGRKPSCELVDCRDLNAVMNGDLIYSTGTTYTSVAEITCHEGYELIGSSVRVCQDNGEWAGAAPICRVQNCGSPSSVQNGSVVHTTDTTFRGTARYTCDTGFVLIGPELRSCQDNQTWSGVDPYCRIRDCGPPPLIINGQRSFAATTYLSTANFTCLVGYSLQGPNELTCQADGIWAPTHFNPELIPICQIVDCGSPGDVSNGNRSFTSGTVYMSNVTFTCNPGYELVGDQQRMCQSDGTWTGSTPQCLVPTPPDITATAVNSTHALLTWNYPQNVVRECDAVYRRVEVGQQDGVIQTTDLQTPVPTGPEMRVTLPFNETEALIYIGEPGTYEFRVICNSTIGMTNFSTPAQAAVQVVCTGSDFECNPNYIYAIVFPVAGLVGVAIVGAVIFIVVKIAARKPPTPPSGVA